MKPRIQPGPWPRTRVTEPGQTARRLRSPAREGLLAAALVLALADPCAAQVYSDVLKDYESRVVTKCLQNPGATACDEFQLQIDAVKGCTDSGGDATAYCSWENPPPITLVGRGFGYAGRAGSTYPGRLWIGDAPCDVLVHRPDSNSSGLSMDGKNVDPSRSVLVCTKYEPPRQFSSTLTLQNEAGENITSPAAVHFGPPLVERVMANESSPCSIDRTQPEVSIECTGSATLTITGRGFPISGRDYNRGVAGDSSAFFIPGERTGPGPDFSTSFAATEAVLLESETNTIPCVFVHSYEDPGINTTWGGPGEVTVLCDLTIPPLGEPRGGAAPGLYYVRVWWGPMVSRGNVTVRIPSGHGYVRSVECAGDHELPHYTWPRTWGSSATAPGSHRLTLVADPTMSSNVATECRVTHELHVTRCCLTDARYYGTASAGFPSRGRVGCSTLRTWADADAACKSFDLRLCTKTELEAGAAAEGVSLCDDGVGVRTWALDDLCPDTVNCYFGTSVTVRGQWFDECMSDFSVTTLSYHDSTVGVTNSSAVVRSLDWDPFNEGYLKLVFDPVAIWRSGAYSVQLLVSGVAQELVPLVVNWFIKPNVTAVRGCHDFTTSTTRCSSRGGVLTMIGTNLHFVHHVDVHNTPCQFNVSAVAPRGEDGPFFRPELNGTYITYGRILCLIDANLDGVANAKIRIRQAALPGPSSGYEWVWPAASPYVTASFNKRPEVRSAVCSLDGGLCPSVDGPITIVGESFDLVPWGMWGETALPLRVYIGEFGDECEYPDVVNATLLICRAYSLRREGLARMLSASLDPVFEIRLSVAGEVSAVTTTATFRRIPFITGVYGCTDDPYGSIGAAPMGGGGPGGARGCNVIHPPVLTIVGGNFTEFDGLTPVKQLQVFVGDSKCEHSVAAPDKLLCLKHRADPLRTNLVKVMMRGEWNRDTELFTVEYDTRCPTVGGRICNGRGLCGEDGRCVCNDSPRYGHWVGEACEQCAPKAWGPDCRGYCMCDPRYGICSEGWNGTGFCHTCIANYSGPLCRPCPGYPGPLCGGHGFCNDTAQGDGGCACVDDWWDPGKNCEDCHPLRWGKSCEKSCPAQGCGVGECVSGVAGTGKCKCREGYGGQYCANRCPVEFVADVVVYCSGHGFCNTEGMCSCLRSDTDGHWGGRTCDECALGYSGDTCTYPCPVVDNKECAGHGNCTVGECHCSEGYCGWDCSHGCAAQLPQCPNPWEWGDDTSCPDGVCTCECPRHEGEVCSGHGDCDSGRYGSGRCKCWPEYAGRLCQHYCGECVAAGGGTCDSDGRCVCRYGYAGVFCENACPGTEFGETCGGEDHGRCDGGNVGTGKCHCLLGYAGVGCEIECEGGSDNPCSGHGACSPVDGLCQCNGDPGPPGWWDGDDCGECRPPWVRPHCNRTCPGHAPGSPVTCSGHGRCDGRSLRCECAADLRLGFWTGLRCDECQIGFWGPNCTSQCTGGACEPCSGHGQCWQGVGGNGRCYCSYTPQGYWVGDLCDGCGADHFGESCDLNCPGFGSPAGVCHGRGKCHDGRAGNGTCSCHVDSAGGHWDGPNCEQCAPDFYGVDCNLRCPMHNSLTCGGHGHCSDGTAGFGNCTCVDWYRGPSCSHVCPGYGAANGICNGHGGCYWGGDVDPRALCACTRDSTSGYWDDASDCTDCSHGYFGRHTDCNSQCPGGATNPCFGKSKIGACNTTTGECDCLSGYGGTGCNLECPGGAKTPCSFHGDCNPLTAACTCYDNDTMGHWTGAACDRCRAMYTDVSVDCRYRCPDSAAMPGVPCSGSGQCVPAFNKTAVGQCTVCSTYTETRCGEACERVGTQCQEQCGEPKWGQHCEHWCPGSTPADPTACTGHGLCDMGKTGSGNCACDTGWRGALCNIECDACVQGQGYCSYTDGKCVCYPGFAGALCQQECPGTYRSPCGSYNAVAGVYEIRGTCDYGRTGSGTCACILGWRGTDCSLRCPAITDEGMPCNGHGECFQNDEKCACSRSDIDGHWAQPDCVFCADGYAGVNCTDACVNGRTVQQDCVCNPGYYGGGCRNECPGVVTDAAGVTQWCSGHGQCDYGRDRPGTCVCDVGYNGGACETYCIVTEHCTSYRLEGVFCGVDGCECIRNSTHGFWTGATCDSCAREYWGPKCLDLCDCNNHQKGCDQRAGFCSCFADAVNGFFTGTNCELCADGYVGEDCRSPDVRITRVASYAAPATFNFRNIDQSIMITDEQWRRIIVFSEPPAVYEFGSGDAAFSQDLTLRLSAWTGTVTSASIDGTTISVVNNRGSQVEVLRLDRFALSIHANVSLTQTVSTFTINGRRAAPTAARRSQIARAQDSRRHSSRSRRSFPLQQTLTLLEVQQVAALRHLEVSYLIYDVGAELQIRGVGLGALQGGPLEPYELENAWRLTHFDTFHAATAAEGAVYVAGSLQSRHDISAFKLGSDGTAARLTSIDPASGAPLNILHTFLLSSVTGLQQVFEGAPVAFQSLYVNSGVLYVAARRGSQLLLLRLSTAEFWRVAVDPGNGAESAAPQAPPVKCPAGPAETGVRCSVILANPNDWLVEKIMVEPATGDGYLTVSTFTNGSALPSTLYRFNTTTLQVDGSNKLDTVAGEAENAVDIGFLGTESLLLVLPSGVNLKVIGMNNFYIERAEPTVVDMMGGTNITMVGKGFPVDKDPTPGCRYNNAVLPLVRASSTEVVCSAVRQVMNQTDCNGKPVDLSFISAERFTSNDNVRVRQVHSATPLEVTPDKGYFNKGVRVTISGYGFDNSSWLTCKFHDDKYATPTPATFVTSTTLECTLPAWPRPTRSGQGRVAVTQDGAYYPETFVPFTVVGTVSRLVIKFDGLPLGEALTIRSNRVSMLPSLTADAVDSENHQVYPLEIDPLEVTANATMTCFPDTTDATQTENTTVIVHGDGRSAHPITNLPFTPLERGRAQLSGLLLRSPEKADCTLVLELHSGMPGLRISGNVLLRAMYRIIVTAGAGAELRILQQPVPIINPATALLPKPRLEVRDAGGNRVILSPGMVVRASVIAEPNSPDLEDNSTDNTWELGVNQKANVLECTCSGMYLPHAIHGVVYRIHFEALRAAGSVPLTAPPTVSTAAPSRATAVPSAAPSTAPSVAASNMTGNATGAPLQPNANDANVTLAPTASPTVDTNTTASDVDPTIRPVTADGMYIGQCGAGRAAILYTSQCRSCPLGGICNGSEQVNVKYGYWRWTNWNRSDLYTEHGPEERARLRGLELTMYRCYPAEVCVNEVFDENGTLAMEGAPIPVCRRGHDVTSLSCHDCSSGYGLSGQLCEKCPEMYVAVLQAVLIVIALLVFLTIAIFTTYHDNITGAKSMGFIAMKQVLTWLQSSAASSGGVRTEWPTHLKFVFELQRKVLDFHTGVHPFNCITQMNLEQRYEVIMLVPCVMFGIFVILLTLLYIYQLLTAHLRYEPPKTPQLSIEDSITFTAPSPTTPSTGSVESADFDKPQVVNLFGMVMPALDYQGRTDHKPKRRVVKMQGPRAEQGLGMRFFKTPLFPDLFKHTQSEELVMQLSRPPPSDVTLVPTGPGLTFVPPVLAFSTGTVAASFSVVGNVLGNHEVAYKVTGTDKKLYPCPPSSTIFIFDEWQTNVIDKGFTCVIVLFFFISPLLFSTMTAVIPCEYMGPDGQRFLTADLSVECDTADWRLLQVHNTMAFAVYIVLLPFAAFVAMLINRDCLEHPTVRGKFGFLFRGLKPGRWYWEFVVMARKYAVIAAATFNTSLWYRLYVCQWIFVAALVLNIAVHPYTSRANHLMENLILVCQVLTMNLGMFYFTEGISSNVRLASEVGLFVVNVLLFFGLLVAYVMIWKTMYVQDGRHRKFREALLGMFDEDGDGEVTWKEVVMALFQRVLGCCKKKKENLAAGREYFNAVKNDKFEQQQNVRFMIGLCASSVVAQALPTRAEMMRRWVTLPVFARTTAAAAQELTENEWGKMRHAMQNFGVFSPRAPGSDDTSYEEGEESSEDELDHSRRSSMASRSETGDFGDAFARDYVRMLHGHAADELPQERTTLRMAKRPSAMQMTADGFGFGRRRSSVSEVPSGRRPSQRKSIISPLIGAAPRSSFGASHLGSPQTVKRSRSAGFADDPLGAAQGQPEGRPLPPAPLRKPSLLRRRSSLGRSPHRSRSFASDAGLPEEPPKSPAKAPARGRADELRALRDQLASLQEKRNLGKATR